MRAIKLIWDFKGEDAYKTAIHHQIHLKQFAQKEKLIDATSGVIKKSEFHTYAYLIVQEDIVFKVRDILRPHRAEVME